MTNWDLIKQQLERILKTTVKQQAVPASDWKRMVAEDHGADARSVVHEQHRYFFLYKEPTVVQALEVREEALSAAERQLVELTLEAYRSQDKLQSLSPNSDDERKAGAIRSWIVQELEAGVTEREMPETVASLFPFYTPKIPILLYGGYSDQRKTSYQELKKLLESFFEGDVVLLPLLEKEWLILVPESLLTAGASDNGKDDGEEEALEETLGSICDGLHEMLASEWLGECHLSVSYPIRPSKTMLQTVVRLREAITLGQTYHMAEYIHLPWKLHMEKLLHWIPEEEKSEFVERILKRMDALLDLEMLTTLEQFLALDCNVSETAKRLFIHRNTLLYRLDKFKQETGLEVRNFRHAVLVYVALLLYKVTKSK
ncbi:PucR family transcriptional regulator [Paenibacillus koleovorans]|uniref:PucR family transcriptional regulator n=1 Tax=Paenibacillus koleovorans TaxID=121608 RepID=UPI001FEB4B7F|nr:helix-turn-helix domain-containing protein [Paenibacillus koleovorans]